MIELIQKFESDFIEAGKLAMSLRKDATVEHKYDSGIEAIDIVTSSDLAVQEFILKKLAKSDLVKCQLIAEEDTPSCSLFADESELVLTLDPIDGTKQYAEGGKFYSVIVTLHDKKRPLYTFDYFPELGWGIKMVNDEVSFIGQTPVDLGVEIPKKTISYPGFEGMIHPSQVAPEVCENG